MALKGPGCWLCKGSRGWGKTVGSSREGGEKGRRGSSEGTGWYQEKSSSCWADSTLQGCLGAGSNEKAPPLLPWYAARRPAKGASK